MRCGFCKVQKDPPHSSGWHVKHGLPVETECRECKHLHAKYGIGRSDCQVCDCKAHTTGQTVLWPGGKAPDQLDKPN